MWAPSWSWVLVANALLGISQGLTWSTTVIMKIDLAGPQKRGLAMGLNEFAGYFAVAGSALATGIVAARYGLRPEPFYLGVVYVTLGFVLSVLVVRETKNHVAAESKLHGMLQAENTPTQREVFWRTSLHDKNLSSVSQAGLINNLNDGMAWGLFPLFFAAAGLNLGQIGTLAAVYPGTWGVAQLFTGALSDRVGRKWLIASGMWVQALGIGVVIGSSGFAGFAAGQVLLGLGTAMVYPTLLAAIGDVAHPAWRASSVGVYRLWRDLGYAVGALLAGATADALGLPAAIWLVAAITFASGVVVSVRMSETLRKTGARRETRATTRGEALMEQRPIPKHFLLCALFLSCGCAAESRDVVDDSDAATDGGEPRDSSNVDSAIVSIDASHTDAANVDCTCVRGGYEPVCGVDGKTYDAVCGRSCVPVQIQCDGQCPCPAGAALKWYTSCGAPVCDNNPAPYDSPSIPNCAPNSEGKACDSAGAVCDGVATCGATYVCAKSDPRLLSCPMSRARFKEDIAYLTEGELHAYHERVVSMPLAYYHYRARRDLGPQLGFIIEDIEPSVAVSGDRVNLYGYLSMAVAAIKVQQAQIESLQRQVKGLRAREGSRRRATESAEPPRHLALAWAATSRRRRVHREHLPRRTACVLPAAGSVVSSSLLSDNSSV
jgi:MFS family permease